MGKKPKKIKNPKVNNNKCNPKELTAEDRNLIRHKKRLNYLRTRRNLRQLEINIHRSRVLTRFFATLILMWVIFKLATLPYWNLNPKILTYYPNHTLSIDGNKIVSTKQIINQIKDIKLPSKPIYLVNTIPIEKSIMKLAPIKKVYIRRFWFPARLKIVVEEKKPVLAISPSPQAKPIAVFTQDATIIDKTYLPLSSSFQVFNVLTHDDHTQWSKMHVKYIVQLSQLIEDNSKENLIYLDIRTPDDVYAQLANVKLRIGELDATTFRRIQRIAAVLPEAMKIKDSISYIDLRWDNSTSIKLKDKDEIARDKAILKKEALEKLKKDQQQQDNDNDTN